MYEYLFVIQVCFYWENYLSRKKAPTIRVCARVAHFTAISYEDRTRKMQRKNVSEFLENQSRSTLSWPAKKVNRTIHKRTVSFSSYSVFLLQFPNKISDDPYIYNIFCSIVRISRLPTSLLNLQTGCTR